jgi:hypothetical protein
MTMLCVACAVQYRKAIDIREKQWQLATCPSCEKPQQLLWPVIELPADQSKSQAQPVSTSLKSSS